MSVYNIVTSVIASNFTTLRHFISDQTALEVYDHTVAALAAIELSKRDYSRVVIYDFIKGLIQYESYETFVATFGKQ